MNSYPTIKLQDEFNSARKERLEPFGSLVLGSRAGAKVLSRPGELEWWFRKEFGIRRAMWDASEMRVVVKLTNA
jgi:hypothetical protein